MVRRQADRAHHRRRQAPEDVVEECLAYLKDRFGAIVESRTVREEHVSFPLPRELRVVNA